MREERENCGARRWQRDAWIPLPLPGRGARALGSTGWAQAKRPRSTRCSGRVPLWGGARRLWRAEGECAELLDVVPRHDSRRSSWAGSIDDNTVQPPPSPLRRSVSSSLPRRVSAPRQGCTSVAGGERTAVGGEAHPRKPLPFLPSPRGLNALEAKGTSEMRFPRVLPLARRRPATIVHACGVPGTGATTHQQESPTQVIVAHGPRVVPVVYRMSRQTTAPERGRAADHHTQVMIAPIAGGTGDGWHFGGTAATNRPSVARCKVRDFMKVCREVEPLCVWVRRVPGGRPWPAAPVAASRPGGGRAWCGGAGQARRRWPIATGWKLACDGPGWQTRGCVGERRGCRARRPRPYSPVSQRWAAAPVGPVSWSTLP